MASHPVTDAVGAPGSCARGFTLMELLVVITIIAILAGILLPAITMVKRSAQGSNCASNQRQVFLAMGSYTNDNEGMIPAGYWGSSASTYISWDDQLSAYDGRDLPMTGSGRNNQSDTYLQMSGIDPKSVKLYGLYTCPAETYRSPLGQPNCWIRSYAFTSGYPHVGGSSVKGIYSPVGFSGSSGWSFSTADGMDWTPSLGTCRTSAILMAEIRYPYAVLGSNMGITVDNPAVYAPAIPPTGCNPQIFCNSSAVYYGTTPLHGSSWNYLFVDGHVERLTPERTVSTWPIAGNAADGMWLR